MTDQLHLTISAEIGREFHATLDLNDSMALFLMAFSVALVTCFACTTAVMIVKALRQK